MFDPWIGSQFGVADNAIGGLKLLMVGESHYPGERAEIGKSDARFTNEAIQKYAIAEPYLFFRTIVQLVLGDSRYATRSVTEKDFWEGVAFYNFIPVFIAPPCEKKRPKVSEWKLGKDVFLKILETVKPSFVLVCGLDLWWWVMDTLPGGAKENDPKRDFAQIASAKGLRIHHPSSRGPSRYSYVNARPMFEKLIG